MISAITNNVMSWKIPVKVFSLIVFIFIGWMLNPIMLVEFSSIILISSLVLIIFVKVNVKALFKLSIITDLAGIISFVVNLDIFFRVSCIVFSIIIAIGIANIKDEIDEYIDFYLDMFGTTTKIKFIERYTCIDFWLSCNKTSCYLYAEKSYKQKAVSKIKKEISDICNKEKRLYGYSEFSAYYPFIFELENGNRNELYPNTLASYFPKHSIKRKELGLMCLKSVNDLIFERSEFLFKKLYDNFIGKYEYNTVIWYFKEGLSEYMPLSNSQKELDGGRKYLLEFINNTLEKNIKDGKLKVWNSNKDDEIMLEKILPNGKPADVQSETILKVESDENKNLDGCPL